MLNSEISDLLWKGVDAVNGIKWTALCEPVNRCHIHKVCEENGNFYVPLSVKTRQQG